MVKRKKPVKGNNCESCERRFTCLTLPDGDVCPTINGSSMGGGYIYYNNLAVYPEYDGKGADYNRYRISDDELMKLVKKARFRTVKKRNVIHLEVIE